MSAAIAPRKYSSSRRTIVFNKDSLAELRRRFGVACFGSLQSRADTASLSTAQCPLRVYSGHLPADNIMRLHARRPVIESGFVWLPEEAHWLDDLMSELAAFPMGRHDDQVIPSPRRSPGRSVPRRRE